MFWITNIVLSIVDKNQFRYNIFIEAQTIFSGSVQHLPTGAYPGLKTRISSRRRRRREVGAGRRRAPRLRARSVRMAKDDARPLTRLLLHQQRLYGGRRFEVLKWPAARVCPRATAPSPSRSASSRSQAGSTPRRLSLRSTSSEWIQSSRGCHLSLHTSTPLTHIKQANRCLP